MNMHRSSSARLNLEALEDRSLMTTATFSGGVLSILGTVYAERIEVTQTNGNVSIAGVIINKYVGATVTRVNSIAAQECSMIDVQALAGNDNVQLRTTTVRARVQGGGGNDFIVGTQAADMLFGGGGNDSVFGMAGGDQLVGGAGNDNLFGMEGTDGLFGGLGADFLDDGNRSYQEYANGGDGLDWNADVIAVNGMRREDVHQRGAPTCSFLSTLSGLAQRGYNFRNWIRYAGFTGQGVPQYDVAFWTGGGWTWTRINFNSALTSNDPAPALEGESWVVVMQRAWQQFRASRGFAADGRAWPHEASYALTGRNATAQYRIDDADYNRMFNALRNGDLVIAATRDGFVTTNTLVGGHAYTVVDVWSSGSDRWVLLRNPWGYDGAASYDNPNDALVWVRWVDFKASMNYLAITDL